jgi:AraC-like DNA-binding protein
VILTGDTHPFTARFIHSSDVLDISLPWSGQVATGRRHDDEIVSSHSGGARVVSLLDGMRVSGTAGALTTVLHIPLRLALAGLVELGADDFGEATFDRLISIPPEFARRFRRAALFAAQELTDRPPPATHLMIVRNLDDILSMILLDLLSRERERSIAILPVQIRRAEEFMRVNAALPISLKEIAAAAATSPRNLQILFRRFCGITPLKRLREVRLEGARVQLEADPRPSVTRIAQAWGFGHIGRFSIEFRSRFGLAPLQWARERSHFHSNEPAAEIR